MRVGGEIKLPATRAIYKVGGVALNRPKSIGRIIGVRANPNAPDKPNPTALQRYAYDIHRYNPKGPKTGVTRKFTTPPHFEARLKLFYGRVGAKARYSPAHWGSKIRPRGIGEP